VVEEASSGERAIELIAQRAFDLLLLDINMPGIGGIEACRQVRTRKPSVGIIMITVRDTETDIVHALEAGADDYISKPFQLGELVARLRAVLRRTSPPSEAVTSIRIGALELNVNTRLLKRGSEVIHLTPTEFDLLELLMKNQGVLLTHTKLLRAVWGAHYGDQLEYLRTYIRTLRKKIEVNPANPIYIITEPWVGYRFCDPTELSTEPRAPKEK
jgi:two-component system, OmpR family, KDP operon response regulator KdpE